MGTMTSFPLKKEGQNLASHGVGREGRQPHHGPLYIHLVSETARLATFQNWPPGLRQKKEEMAAAGLFYIGMSDQVWCFYCGKGLKEWHEKDDPWVEHAGWWGAECEFMKLVKGKEFIEKSQNIVHTRVQTKNLSMATSLSPLSSVIKTKTKRKESSSINEMQIQNTMKRVMMCKVCLDKDVEVVFLPCRHLVVCKWCAPNMWNCPVCRSKINETIKVFM